MTYFIFDMDETLAELHTVYYFIANLKVAEIFREYGDEMPITLEKSLKKAYRLFVINILIEELSSNPLGILRPGILNIMKQLYDLQRLGKIAHVAIYSNNGHLQSLEFIRDLIHKYLGTNDLIKDCIHWDHFMRIEETKSKYDQPTKTWNVLKNILVMGHCQASEALQQKDVYFFDDQDHTDLQRNLGTNYYKVPSYNFKASYDRIADIYKKCLKNVDMEEYNKVIADVFSIDSYNSLDTILNFFKERTGQTNNGVPPPPDRGIEIMLEAISKLNSHSGGKRQRAKTKKRKPQDHRPQKKIENKMK
jgi:hypothetical protein